MDKFRKIQHWLLSFFRSKHREAFTLIELLVVVSIVGTLASIVVVAINPSRQLEQSTVAANEARANQLEKAIIQYLIDGNSLSGIPNGISNAANICVSTVTGSDCTDINGIDLSVLVSDYVAQIDAGPGASDGQQTSQLCMYRRGSFYDVCVVGQDDCGCGGSVISEGPKDGEDTTNDNSAGNVAWTNPVEAKEQDDSFSFASLNGGNASLHSSEYLLVQRFNFNVPTSATILGIEVEIDKHSINSGIQVEDAAIRLIDHNATILTTDKAVASAWPTSDTDAYVSYGGNADLWGSSWTPAILNNDNFGLALRAQTTCDPAGSCAATSAIPRVDHVRITAYYQTVSCFLPGTLITMADGSQKPIEQVSAGDMVLGVDPESGELLPQKVLNSLERETSDYFNVRIGNNVLRVTAEHPFYVGNGEYRKIADLFPGDIVYVHQEDGVRPTLILNKEYVKENHAVHNIETDGHNNYIADGVLVHNKSVSSSSSVSSGYGG